MDGGLLYHARRPELASVLARFRSQCIPDSAALGRVLPVARTNSEWTTGSRLNPWRSMISFKDKFNAVLGLLLAGYYRRCFRLARRTTRLGPGLSGRTSGHTRAWCAGTQHLQQGRAAASQALD